MRLRTSTCSVSWWPRGGGGGLQGAEPACPARETSCHAFLSSLLWRVIGRDCLQRALASRKALKVRISLCSTVRFSSNHAWMLGKAEVQVT